MPALHGFIVQRPSEKVLAKLAQLVLAKLAKVRFQTAFGLVFRDETSCWMKSGMFLMP
ncbi:MAG: hypothetical protein Q4D78_11000 [Neisseria zoodegmatis]|uniref:hypothetical protein n=1 Tax=Neisseria zoodegmatis TaxID=326523 RepID=UPI0026EFB69D|nr:hypothetical protein [Neisseria zoodegmatis]MDO5070697.1 hypothetical protein [Neisseria zoodegmatis]